METVNFLVFWILAALVTSGSQVAVSGDTGILASGVVYAIFGYQFICREQVERFAQLLDAQTIRLFLFWIILCVILTYFDAWNIGNTAHLSGFGFGCLCGYLIERKQNKGQCFMVVTACVMMIIGSLIYAPWSASWLYSKGTQAYFINL